MCKTPESSRRCWGILVLTAALVAGGSTAAPAWADSKDRQESRRRQPRQEPDRRAQRLEEVRRGEQAPQDRAQRRQAEQPQQAQQQRERQQQERRQQAREQERQRQEQQARAQRRQAQERQARHAAQQKVQQQAKQEERRGSDGDEAAILIARQRLEHELRKAQLERRQARQDLRDSRQQLRDERNRNDDRHRRPVFIQSHVQYVDLDVNSTRYTRPHGGYVVRNPLIYGEDDSLLATSYETVRTQTYRTYSYGYVRHPAAFRHGFYRYGYPCADGGFYRYGYFYGYRPVGCGYTYHGPRWHEHAGYRPRWGHGYPYRDSGLSLNLHFDFDG